MWIISLNAHDSLIWYNFYHCYVTEEEIETGWVGRREDTVKEAGGGRGRPLACPISTMAAGAELSFQ